MNKQFPQIAGWKYLAAGGGLLLITKLLLAGRLNLYSDEIFYWLESTRPAIAYSDLPFMTALLAGIGSALDAGNTLAVRIPFIIMGSSIPLLVYWLALPITNKKQAIESAALTVCIPMGGFLGLLAVPDVPLVFFGLLSIGFFERSLRTDRLAYWLATGMFVALGLSTHYRFFLYPAAAVLFLLCFKGERHQWQNSKFWIAVGIAAIGLTPIIWFNIENQLASASFYFVDRHPWEFKALGLLHIFIQAAVVTPPLYILFAYILWRLLGRDRRKKRSEILIASFALSNIAVYLVLAPWTDSSSTTLHWPLSGYFPLLVFAPSALREIYSLINNKWEHRIAINVIVTIPTLGFIGSMVAILGIGSQSFQLPIQNILGTGILSNKMAGWVEFSGYTAELLNKEFSSDQPIIITDNYYTAAQVEFAGLSHETLTLDEDKALRDGRISQIKLWETGRQAIGSFAGRPALFITEDSTLNVLEKEAVIDEMCRHVTNLDSLGGLSLFNGEKKFSFYIADEILDSDIDIDSDSNSDSVNEYRAQPCPYPTRAWMDLPVVGAELNGTFHMEGWAYKEDIGIDSISLLIDENFIAEVNYGITRFDVAEAMNVKTDPNSPNLGFNYELDTTNLANGKHLLEIQLIDERGGSGLYGRRVVTIKN